MKFPKKLVIDASIALAAGPETKNSVISSDCRQFLLAVLEYHHYLILSDDIRKEWNKHQSIYSRAWRAEMLSKNRVQFVKVVPDNNLRQSITDLSKEKEANAKGISAQNAAINQMNAMLKDCLLIEAALITDRTIASLDEKVRQLFVDVSPKVTKLKRIVWVNPEKAEEEPLRWLKEGAKPEKFRTLGYKALIG